MLTRLAFILIALFWLTMNLLLWRAEFGSRVTGNSPVPTELVWEKILTSPDSSSLSIIHHRKKIGFCHWITSVGEEWAEVDEENIPTGVPATPRAHQLRLEGSALTPDLTNRIRFDGTLKVDARRAWQELDARLSIHLITWQIHSLAAQQTLRLTGQGDEGRFERTWRFSELRNPGALLGNLLGPIANEWLQQATWPAAAQNPAAFDLGVKWEAFEDTLWIGHAPTRVYRLQTRLLDRYSIRLIVSRVGEIVRVELPDELVLANDQFAAFSTASRHD
jgi:hypothetical protein